MIRDEIESVEAASPNILVVQTGQIKRIFPQVFSEGKLILIQLKVKLDNILGK